MMKGMYSMASELHLTTDIGTLQHAMILSNQ